MNDFILFLTNLKTLSMSSKDGWVDGKYNSIMKLVSKSYVDKSILVNNLIEVLKELSIIDTRTDVKGYHYKWSNPDLVPADAAVNYFDYVGVKELDCTPGNFYYMMYNNQITKVQYKHESGNYKYFEVLSGRSFPSMNTIRLYKYSAPERTVVYRRKEDLVENLLNAKS